MERFPDDFMFKLTANEWEFIQSQFATSPENNNPSSQIVMSSEDINLNINFLVKAENRFNRSQIVTRPQKHIRTTSYAFTEQGLTRMASVLRSKGRQTCI
jgi:hypothetical protein